MSASQLSTTKNSLTKQDLINALIEVTKKDTNPLFEVAFDRFSHSFERKFDEKFNLFFFKDFRSYRQTENFGEVHN